jgi:hypothetical protein
MHLRQDSWIVLLETFLKGKDVTKHPTVHRKPYNHPTQNVTDVEIDKLCSKYILSSVEKIF